MDRHDIRPRLAEALDIAHGPVDHQVHVQRQVGDLADARDRGQADGKIGNKQAVHYVNMNILGAGLLDPADVPPEIGKIGSQDRGRYTDHENASNT